MHGLTGGSWKRNKDRTRATEMKDTRGNLAVTSGSETYRRCALPRQLSTLLRRRCGAHPTDPSRTPTLTNVTVPVEVPERRPGVPPHAMGPGPRIQPDPVPKLEHEPGLARSAQPRLGTAGHRVDHHQVSHRRQHPRLVPGGKPECLTGAVHLQRQGDKATRRQATPDH